MAVGSRKQHRGRILAFAVQNSGLTRTEAARRAGYSRSAYYKHIEISDLSFHILEEYGRGLHHNFADDIPGMPQFVLEDPEARYFDEVKGFDDAIRQGAYWRKKYFALLERHNDLLERFTQGPA